MQKFYNPVPSAVK